LAFTSGWFWIFLKDIKPPADKAERKIRLATGAKRESALGFGPTHRPPKFPMKFKVFLQRAFGGRLYADRLHLFRKFLNSEYNFIPGYDVPAKLLKAMTENGIRDDKSYYVCIEQIRQWKQINRFQQRRDANESRWLKENRKKILKLLQKRITDMSQTETCRFAKPIAEKVAGSHRKK